MGNKPPEKFDSIAVAGLVLGLASFFGAFVIAGLSFGGVIGMNTVAICLGLAGLTGAAGIIAGAIWSKPWLREGMRVALSMILCAAIAVSMYWLYGWIERNGHRPNEASAPLQQLAKSETAANTHTSTQPEVPREQPITQQPKTSAPKPVKPHHKAQKKKIEVNGADNQVMNNSPSGVQQHSAGANSPNIVGDGNLIGNTFNIDTHTAPTLSENLQNQLSLALAPYAGSKVMLFIHRGNQSTRAFAEALTSAMQKDSIEVVGMGEGNQFPEPPPGVSCLVSENRMGLAGTLANFLVNNRLLPNKLPVKTAPQPDRVDCTIAPW